MIFLEMTEVEMVAMTKLAEAASKERAARAAEKEKSSVDKNSDKKNTEGSQALENISKLLDRLFDGDFKVQDIPEEKEKSNIVDEDATTRLKSTKSLKKSHHIVDSSKGIDLGPGPILVSETK